MTYDLKLAERHRALPRLGTLYTFLRPSISSALILRGSLRLRPALLRPLTELPLRQLLQPALRPLDLAHLKVVLPTSPTEHLRPSINGLTDLLPRLPQLLLAMALLPAADLDAALLIEVGHVYRHVRPLGAAEVGRGIFLEAACDESARCVAAGEDVVGAAWTVDTAAGRHVVDRAV